MTERPLTYLVNFDHQTDEALAQLVKQGRQEAFSALYERHFSNVYKRVRYSIPERDVEDVTQEIFIAAMRSLKTYRGEAAFRTWLRTLASRQIADYYRHRKSVDADLKIYEELDEDDESEGIILGEMTALDRPVLDDQIILSQCLRRLPDHYREVILLRFVEGLPFNEISTAQHMNLEATKSLFRRAIIAIQKMLEEAGYER